MTAWQLEPWGSSRTRRDLWCSLLKKKFYSSTWNVVTKVIILMRKSHGLKRKGLLSWKSSCTVGQTIMHYNGDFGKITEKCSSEGNTALFNSKILISSLAWSNDYNLVPDSMMKSANKLTQYGSRAPNPDRNTIHTSWQKTPKFLALYGSNLDPEE